MSHIATVEVHMKDLTALRKACVKLGLPAPEQVKEKRFFDGTRVSGWAVQLPDWRYPVVFDAEGKAKMDNYNGSWGKIEQFHSLVQRYAVEAATAKAKQQGYRVLETKQANGSVKLMLAK